jgi:hypothetical protein
MSFIESDRSLCRAYIAENTNEQLAWEKRDLLWFKISGITNFYKNVEKSQYYRIFQDILSGCMMTASSIGFLILGTRNEGIQIYAGISDDEELYGAYRRSFEASFPGIDIKDKAIPNKIRKPFGGLMVGIPGEVTAFEKTAEKSIVSDNLLPIDRLCRGMLGTEFSYWILAERQPVTNVTQKRIYIT